MLHWLLGMKVVPVNNWSEIMTNWQYIKHELIFLTRPAVNIAVNKIDIWPVRYYLSRVRVTIVWSLWRHRQSIVTSSAERKASEWDTGIVCEDPRFSVIYGFVMSCKK